MQHNRVVLATAFIVLSGTGIFLTIQNLIDQEEETKEGYLMSETCTDIQAYETLRAESDFDMLVNTVGNHIHPTKSADILVQESLSTIRKLKDEAALRNMNEATYEHAFATILDKLSLVEIKDALTYLKQDDLAKSRQALKSSKHYLHDALIFSRKDKKFFQSRLDILHEINKIDPDQLNEGQLKTLQLRLESWLQKSVQTPVTSTFRFPETKSM